MAVASSAYLNREYRRAQVSAARPTQLVVMLYDGAIRFLSIARERMVAGDVPGRHEFMLKGQNIINGLMGTLDLDKGGQVAYNLRRLYVFMYERLVEANLFDRVEDIDLVVSMLSELRESWVELDARQTAGGTGEVTADAAA